MVVVLPEPLTPTTRMTNGFRLASIVERPCDRFERAGDFLGEDRLHRLRLDSLVVAAAADRLADAGRGGEAEIGLDEDVLERVERIGVELALGEDVGDAAAERRGGARQAGGELGQPAAARRLARFRRGRRVVATAPAAQQAGFRLVVVGFAHTRILWRLTPTHACLEGALVLRDAPP